MQKPFHVYKQKFVLDLMILKTPVLYMMNFRRIFLVVKSSPNNVFTRDCISSV